MDNMGEYYFRKYGGLDNSGRIKALYFYKLAAMNDGALTWETKDMIWLSAYASNNPRSDYHWQVDACYEEWGRRGDQDGYSRAYNEVVAEYEG